MVVVGLGVVLAGGGFALLVRQARLDAEKENFRQHVSFILMDLWNYSAGDSGLPPAVVTGPDGRPLYSWRFATAALLLGDPVQRGYYGQSAHRDKPWDGPENRRYREGPHRDYGGSPQSYIDPTRPGGMARFGAVVGPGAAFDPDRRRKLDDLPGGLVVLVEVTGSEAHWMQPGGDVDPRTVPRQIGVAGGIGPAAAGGTEFWVGFADRSVRLLRADIPFEVLAPFLTVEGAGSHDRDAALGPHTVRSWP